eukprot:g801.t1
MVASPRLMGATAAAGSEMFDSLFSFESLNDKELELVVEGLDSHQFLSLESDPVLCALNGTTQNNEKKSVPLTNVSPRQFSPFSGSPLGFQLSPNVTRAAAAGSGGTAMQTLSSNVGGGGTAGFNSKSPILSPRRPRSRTRPESLIYTDSPAKRMRQRSPTSTTAMLKDISSGFDIENVFPPIELSKPKREETAEEKKMRLKRERKAKRERNKKERIRKEMERQRQEEIDRKIRRKEHQRAYPRKVNINKHAKLAKIYASPAKSQPRIYSKTFGSAFSRAFDFSACAPPPVPKQGKRKTGRGRAKARGKRKMKAKKGNGALQTVDNLSLAQERPQSVPPTFEFKECVGTPTRIRPRPRSEPLYRFPDYNQSFGTPERVKLGGKKKDSVVGITPTALGGAKLKSACMSLKSLSERINSPSMSQVKAKNVRNSPVMFSDGKKIECFGSGLIFKSGLKIPKPIKPSIKSSHLSTNASHGVNQNEKLDKSGKQKKILKRATSLSTAGISGKGLVCYRNDKGGGGFTIHRMASSTKEGRTGSLSPVSDLRVRSESPFMMTESSAQLLHDVNT